MEQNKSSRGALAFVLGFLVGATAGAATAILLTPEAGTDTRERLSRRASETAESLGKRVAEVRQMATDLAGDLKEDVTEWAQKTRERLNTNGTKDGRGMTEEVVSNN